MGELLMMSSVYGPFIHAGGRNSGGKSLAHAHPDTFGLWATLDGMMSVAVEEGAEPERMSGPAVVFIRPGPDHIVTVSAGSQWYFLRFDVVQQPRRRRARSQAWCHDGPVEQPGPQAIWGSTPPTVVPRFLRAGAIQLLRDCTALWWRNDHFHAQANASLGAWLMDYVIYSRRPVENRATGHGLHQQCRDLVHERLGLGIDVGDLADACGYSRVHFTRHFRRVTGMSPGYFIREERMAQACHLLISTADGLEQIAAQCGYRSVSAFSRAFSGLHGMAPGAWRRRYR